MGRRRKSRVYFTKETEQAILEYNQADTKRERDRIYNEHIYMPFNKLAESIFNTFKFQYFDIPREDVQMATVAHLIEKMHRYDGTKGKAFSYFSTVAKNFLILENNFNHRKFKKEALLSAHDGVFEIENNFKLEQEQAEYNELINLMIEYWERNMSHVFKTERELQIADSLLELFKRREYLEHYKKKALYIMVREMTGCTDTQYITRVVNIMKDKWGELKDEYYRTGYITFDDVFFE